MAKQTKETWGGARPGSGRFPVKDKKIPVFTSVLTSHVEAVGGMEEAKKIAAQAIKRAADRLKG